MKRMSLLILIIALLLFALPLASAFTYTKDYYKFDEQTGNISLDVNASVNGIYNPTATNTTGKINTSWNFTGANAGMYVNLSQNTTRTYNFWVNTNGYANGCLGCIDGSGASNRAMLWQVASSTTQTLTLWDTGDVSHTGFSVSNFSMPLRTWTMITLVIVDNSYVKVYQNATLIQQTNIAYAVKKYTPEYFVLGNRWRSGAMDLNLSATFDEFAYSDTEWSSADISYVFNSGSGRYPFNATTNTPNVTFTAYNYITNVSLQSFSISVTNGSVVLNQSTTNGTINTIIPSNSTQLWTVQYFSNETPLYWNQTYLNVNVSSIIINKSLEPMYLVNRSFTAFDFFTNLTMTNFSITDQFGNTSTTTTGLLNASLYRVFNQSQVYNITYSSTLNGGYMNELYQNLSVIGANNKSLAQSMYSFYAVEKVTGVTLSSFNFSTVRLGTTYVINQTQYLSNGTYNVTAFRSGYYNKTAQIDAVALFNGTQNISYVGNHTLNITVRSNTTGLLIGTATVVLSNSTYGYSETFTTSGGRMFDNTTSVSLNYVVSASGYFPKSGTLALTGNASNNTIYLLASDSLNVVFIRQSNGTVISNQASTITFQNSTNSTSYTINNGTGNVTGLVDGSYTVLCQSAGYSNNSYTLVFSTTSEPPIFYCIMSVGTTPITFQVQSPDLTPLSGVLVTVSQFVNGSIANVSQEYTDGTGQTVMNLVQGITTTITLELAGYVTQVNTNSLDATTYTYTLDPISRIDPSNNAGSDIVYSFYPTAYDLNLTVWNFALNTSVLNNATLAYTKIEIRDINNTLLNTINATSPSGNQIILPFNVTPYNGSILRVYYIFQKTNSTQFIVPITYNIRDIEYTGSVTEAKSYILNHFSLGERIFLWMLLTIISAVLLYRMGLRDLLNVFVVSFIWLGLAWVFSMNMLIVGFIFFVMFICIVRFSL